MQQKLSPQQIQFIQLLQLNTTELEKRVDEELAENQGLEAEAEDGSSNDPVDEFADISQKDDKVIQDEIKPEGDQLETDVDYEEPTSSVDELDFEANEVIDDEFSQYLSGDDDNDYTYNAFEVDNQDEDKDVPFAATSTLYEQLLEQLESVRLSEHQKVLGRHLIGMIEEDGYLRRPLKNIVFDMAFTNQVKTTEEELEFVLREIQQFDPPGIGARDLVECLTLQLIRKDTALEKVQIARRIIKDHMDDLAKKHYDKLMKSLKISRDDLKEVLDLITHLDPKPGESQINIKTQYIIPDFIVTNQENVLIVNLNSKNAPELRISRSYSDTMRGFQQAPEKTKTMKKEVQYIKQKLDNAKWFIDAIKQRQNTLLLTMKTIVAFQREFFLTSDIERLQPMILKDIADRIGMDISTVSRVVNSKYVQTDFGIYSLKEFFSEGIQTDSGEEVSNKEVKSILREMIEQEDKKRPLTDEKLTDMLNERGYNIARRTVAKYREQLGIQVARLRKGI